MSMLLMVRAMNTKVGNPLRKLVLIKLADNANDSGECWPSYQHIADQCEISARSVIRHIDALCEAGLLQKQHRPGPKGNSSNLYQITLRGDRESLGVVTESHKGGDTVSPGGSDRESPRTSHSFEPVNEPKKVSRKRSGFDPISARPECVSVKAWADWCQHRREIRKALTSKSVEQQSRVLSASADADGLIYKSIANGWTGIFPDGQAKPPAPSRHHGFDKIDYSKGLGRENTDGSFNF